MFTQKLGQEHKLEKRDEETQKTMKIRVAARWFRDPRMKLESPIKTIYHIEENTKFEGQKSKSNGGFAVD